jgi:predicted enzyme related to lactoylglutathione lyase
LTQALGEDNRPKPFQPLTIRSHYTPHLTLQSDDLDKTMSALKAFGIKIVQGPLETPGAGTWLYIRDADLNVVEFFQDFSSIG